MDYLYNDEKGVTMKKYIVSLMVCFLLAGIVKADDVRVIFRDYNPMKFNENPVGIGLASWTDKTDDLAPAIYGQLAFVSWQDKVRLNFGAAVGWKDSIHELRLRPITSITTLISVKDLNFEVGGYHAPFWGLESGTDDPYGILIGLAF